MICAWCLEQKKKEKRRRKKTGQTSFIRDVPSILVYVILRIDGKNSRDDVARHFETCRFWFLPFVCFTKTQKT